MCVCVCVCVVCLLIRSLLVRLMYHGQEQDEQMHNTGRYNVNDKLESTKKEEKTLFHCCSALLASV